MAAELTLYVGCPVCGQPIELDAALRLEMKRTVVGIDTAPVHAHIADHRARQPAAQ